MLRALIIDDEPPARAELRYQLERHADVQVIGEAANAREALQLVQALEYDVLFLDIQMPLATGLDLARALREHRPRPPFVVFVTAHDEHAIPAFDLGAADYLLKPVAAERLQDTLSRLRFLKGQAASAEADTRTEAADRTPQAPAEAPRFIAGVDGERTIPVPLREISYLVAEGDAVYLVSAGGGRYQVRATLHELQRTLPAQTFFRCHRGYIVNVREVSEIVPFFNGTYTLKMKGAQRAEVPVSRSNAKRLREVFRFV